MVSTRDAHFDQTYEFTQESGMDVAFAITAYDSNRDPIEDPQYGVLKAYYKTWGLSTGKGVQWTELADEYCTKQELGLNNEGKLIENQSSSSIFFDTHKNSVSDFTYYHKKLKCLK